MTARLGVAAMTAALLLYIILVAERAWLLFTSGDPVGIAIGFAAIVLPIIAVWAVGRELWFGAQSGRLGRRLAGDDDLPSERLETRPSGRILRHEADAVFPTYRDAVRDAPEDWRAWYRLGLAYDGSGDRRRARDAVRTAIRLERRDRSHRATDS